MLHNFRLAGKLHHQQLKELCVHGELLSLVLLRLNDQLLLGTVLVPFTISFLCILGADPRLGRSVNFLCPCSQLLIYSKQFSERKKVTNLNFIVVNRKLNTSFVVSFPLARA